MIFCLSPRMFTAPGTSDRFDLDVEAFVRFAKSCGYDGVSLRPGQLDRRTAPAEVDRIAGLLKAHGAPCSFTMGGAVSDRESYEAHCKLIDDTVRIGCRYVQPSVRAESEIPYVQRLCDYAAERGVRICPQLHNATLHDTVPRCLDLFKKVNRANFGLNFEASHLLMQRTEVQGAAAVRALADRIFTVCVQNYKMAGDRNVACLPGDPEGVDFKEVFGALKAIGFDGFVTHMSGRYPDLDNEVVCKDYAAKLRPLIGA